MDTNLHIKAVQRAATSGQLIVILGAGSSIALTAKSSKAPSWTGLVHSALNYGRDRGLVNEIQHDRYVAALGSDDIDDLIGVAEFVGRKLNAPQGDIYARWMRETFQGWRPDAGAMLNALRAIESQKISIATLNYDTLAESCTGLQAIDFVDTQSVISWIRKEKDGILHLHGVWTSPDNCIFGIRDYQAAIDNQTRSLVQRALSSLNTILFVGCGDTFSDPNFTHLISWLREHVGAAAPPHYALVRDDEVSRRLSDSKWRGFVEPIGYGEKHSDLPAFLLKCFPTRRSPKAPVARNKAAFAQASQIIEAYHSFILRDCGEMTIEGMRADMDTAQRKFNLEKLFVPLEVEAFPPDIPFTDPLREKKLAKWKEENSKPIPFAHSFSSIRKIALLALPGGGKTLLLKRLAVAYGSIARRKAGPDELPDLNLVPVMIRCREWKDHLRSPIPVLLQNICNITGDSSLDGLYAALEPKFKNGEVLLLIDGLDEIHDDADRTIFVENVETFMGTYPNIRLLITSREAGFDLIAPCLSRFCTKLKIAPLNADAITLLCDHWHRLMGTGSPEAMAEASDVTSALLNTDSLRRLAENPLLCTMLLVVKHGFGRLPPDRVSLYDRAVEVLLNTWNIKGHEALNVKEAVPQLACVAYELMRDGKQTATEKEILAILESARVQLPQIDRYAKDSPHEFLKRVELRSSLVLAGGHTIESGKTVPFYQFRHLTFQEYLAAVAAVEGYTIATKYRSSVLSALADNLVTDEWKEVVPMAAVLARSQATPLLESLLIEAERERDDLLSRGCY